MEALVMGIQKIDFVDKQNNPIEGKRLYLAFSEESVQGYRTESVSYTHLDDYYKQTGRRVTFEYSLVAGVNDGPDDVKELTGILKHRNCHLNLIPVNPIKERDFKKPDSKKAMEFQNKLEKNGINVTIRRERGSDIDGACGQLRRRYGAVKEERPDEDICED